MKTGAFYLAVGRPHALKMDDGTTEYETVVTMTVERGNVLNLTTIADTLVDELTPYSSLAHAQYDGNRQTTWIVRFADKSKLLSLEETLNRKMRTKIVSQGGLVFPTRTNVS